MSTFHFSCFDLFCQYLSFILSTCPNHRNTLLSTFSVRVSSIPPSDFLFPNPIPSHNPHHRSQELHFKHIQAAPLSFLQPSNFSTIGYRGDYNLLTQGFLYPKLIVLPFRTLFSATSNLFPSKTLCCASA